MPDTIQCPECQTSLRVRKGMEGKKVKCPRCANLVMVPGATAEPAARAPADAITEVEPLPEKGPAEATRRCPECGKKIPADARKCRFCKARVEPDAEGDEEEDREEKARPKYKACPQCGARKAKRVKWTAWGSYYGPTLFNHVRCSECQYAFNGKTGKSNAVPIFFFVAIPALAIIAILIIMTIIVLKRMDMM